MQNIQQNVKDYLKAFHETHNPDELAEAVDLLETLQPEMVSSPKERKRFRMEKLQLQLAVLGQLDSSLEPSFNLNDLPSLNVGPPPETRLPSGVDPTSIADPRLRSEYERAISANQQKAKKYKLQSKLHQIDRRATTQIEAHLASTYSASPGDLAELDKLFDDSAVTTRRKASLRQFVRTLRKH
jgi:hypothetical protein